MVKTGCKKDEFTLLCKGRTIIFKKLTVKLSQWAIDGYGKGIFRHNIALGYHYQDAKDGIKERKEEIPPELRKELNKELKEILQEEREQHREIKSKEAS